MLPATCEQKAVTTDFVLCRAFLVLFERQKVQKERLEGEFKSKI